MDLADAQALAGRFIELIAPYCEKVLIVGSIRRKRPQVNDIDLVAISKVRVEEQPDWFTTKTVRIPELYIRITDLIRAETVKVRTKKDGKVMVGDKIAMVEFEGFGVDIYYADWDTWGGLVLIRTGSVEHNIILTTKAGERGWKLHADGTGVWNTREDIPENVQLDKLGFKRLDDGTEEGIFKVLEVPYREPWERDVTL